MYDLLDEVLERDVAAVSRREIVRPVERGVLADNELHELQRRVEGRVAELVLRELAVITRKLRRAEIPGDRNPLVGPPADSLVHIGHDRRVDVTCWMTMRKNKLGFVITAMMRSGEK